MWELPSQFKVSVENKEEKFGEKKLAFDMKEKNVVFEIFQSLQKYFVSSFKENLYFFYTTNKCLRD